MLKKKIALGIDDFKEVMQENIYFVDKSLLIHDFMEDASKIIVLPRPRRFGKTLNMSMLKYFLDNKESSADLFTGLEIAKNRVFFEKHLNKHPLIYLSLKDVKKDTWSESFELIKDIISQEYKRHKNIIESLDKDEKEYYEKVMFDGEKKDIEESLLKLTRYLEKHYKKKAIVLIDEYDATIHKAYVEGYYEKAISFFQMFYGSVFKGNIHLNKGLMTGILRVSKESIFSGLNNANVVSILSNHYCEYFGFTEEETFKFVEEYGLDTKGMKDWYNGYQIGNNKMYNPWSVINYVYNKGELKEYWINTSSNDLIYESIKKISIEVKRDILKLLARENIYKNISEDVNLKHLDGEVAFYSLLLFTGYLTWDREGSSIETGIYELKMPNHEVKSFFNKLVSELSKTTGEVSKLIISIERGRWEEFGEEIGKYLMRTMSYYDLSSKSKEKDYQLLLLGMLSTLETKYEIRSNRESGTGRYDILLKRKEKEEGAIFEIKASESREKLEEDALKAIKQIEDRKYGEGIEGLTKIGMAFYGKEAKVIFK